MTTATLPTRSRRVSRQRRAIDIRHSEPEDLWRLAEQLHGRPIPGVRMTEAQFEEWCDEDLRAEWVDGEIIISPPSHFEHASLNTWFTALLRMYTEEQDLGIIRTNMSVRLSSQRRWRCPDLFFISKDRQHLMRPTYFDGAPDVAIEIVSPDSQSRDRREKFSEYEKAGVREYWIIDPLSKTAELYRLERKRFQVVDEIDGMLASSVLRGFRLKPAQLWRRPLPKVSTALRQLAVGK
jgi:Uma2 family endonuclease